MPANLSLGNRFDPTQSQIDPDRHDPNDPKDLCVVHPIISEDDCKHNPTEIARGARAARHDTVGVGVHVRHEREVGAVSCFEEEGHASDQTEHGALGVGVCEADGDFKGASDDRETVDQVFLAPDAGCAVDDVAEDTARRSEDDVQETEHGGPLPGAALAESFEVFEVVCPEDGVDCEFGAKGAEVAAAGDEGLEGEDDRHGLFERRLLNNLAPRGVEHLLFADLGLMITDAGTLVRCREAYFLAMAMLGSWRIGTGGVGLLVGEFARNINDIAGNSMAGEILLRSKVALTPLASRCIRAEDQHGDGDRSDDDEGDDE